MQHDQAHAFPDALGDALDDLVLDLAMGGMAPPDQHVGIGKRLDGAAMLGLLQRRGLGDDVAVFGQQARNLVVHAGGIIVGNDLVLLLVDVFAPDQGTDRHFQAPGLIGQVGRHRPFRCSLQYSRACGNPPILGEISAGAGMTLWLISVTAMWPSPKV
ncbi:hypothetical protein D3C72_1580430 [compost metagenome]